MDTDAPEAEAAHVHVHVPVHALVEDEPDVPERISIIGV